MKSINLWLHWEEQTITVLQLAASHWRFYEQFQHLADRISHTFSMGYHFM